jgi:hypothetical protein
MSTEFHSCSRFWTRMRTEKRHEMTWVVRGFTGFFSLWPSESLETFFAQFLETILDSENEP